MTTLLQDLRYALHAFRRTPGFTLAVIASLAIGIGANTALFSVTSALILRPLPYQDADRLVILWNRSPGLNIAEDWVSPAQYFDVKNSHQGFEQVALAFGDTQNLTGVGAPDRVGVVRVSSNLLPMLGVRPALGRLYLQEEDYEGRAPTVVLAHGLWDRRFGRKPDAIGKPLTLNGRVYEIVGVLPPSFTRVDSTAPWVTVVGVVGRVKHEALEADPRITAYIPHTQSPRCEMTVVVRTTGDPAAFTSAARARLAKLDPDLPVYSVRTMESRVAGSLARRRFSMVLLALFAGLALVLATLGTYATMAYLVSQGRKEIGIRIALGATPAHVLALILRQGFALAVAGALAGLAGGLTLTRVMEPLLFGVAATDAATFTAVPLLLTFAALAACYFPARRAAATDPLVSLHFE